MAIMGIVLVQNVTMLEIWTKILTFVENLTGIANYAFIFTIVFAVGVSIPVGLLAMAGKIAGKANLESTRQNFARFGYALIPLDVAGHVAHNLFHLLAEGKSVLYTIGSVFGASASGSTALVGMGTIRVLQFIVLALGLVGSLYTVKRIVRRTYPSSQIRKATMRPYVILVSVLAALNVALFLFPMAHRM